MKKLSKTQEVVQYTSRFVSGKTVDLGAGNAKYKKIIQPHTTEYVTFDIAPAPNIDIVGDILNLPFAENTFDTAVSTQVLEHVTKPWIMVKEIHRVLKPGGTIILSAPFMFPYHAHPYDYFRFTVEGMKGLFEDTGFNVVECQSYGSFFAVLAEVVHLTLFNPYHGRGKTKVELKIIRTLEAIAAFLDSCFPIGIVYPNVYIIAKKK